MLVCETSVTYGTMAKSRPVPEKTISLQRVDALHWKAAGGGTEGAAVGAPDHSDAFDAYAASAAFV
jgi:hypothetical protein